MKTNDGEDRELPWVLDILTYPFRGSGKYILLTLVVLSVIGDILQFAPLLGIVAGFLMFAYFCAIYLNLVDSSAVGDSEAPTFPEISNLVEDVFVPTLRILGCLFSALLPFLAFLFLMPEDENLALLGTYGLLLFAGIYFPMALLAVTILGYLGAAGPHIVIPAIFRAMPHYLIAVAIFAAIIGLQVLLQYLFGENESIPWLARYALFSVIGAYALMANARTLGLVYREREEQLGWV